MAQPADIRVLHAMPIRSIFFGTLAGDVQSGFFNILYVVLLGLIVGLSMSWSFTEEWGEYFALHVLGDGRHDAADGGGRAGHAVLDARDDDDLPLPEHGAGEDEAPVGGGGPQVFRLRLGLVGALPVRAQPALRHDGHDLVRRRSASSCTRHGRDRPGGQRRRRDGDPALMLVGFGFKVAAVPFHQWAPDAYEGAPAPVTAWIATGSKLASFVALMKVFLHALLPWSSPSTSIMGPGWIGIVAIIAAVTMTYGNFAALAQRNFKRMLAYSSIAHAGYILVGVAAVSVSMNGPSAAGAVLYYLVVYAFANVGAFAVAAWLARDMNSDDIDDLNGLGFQEPLLATCILMLMLSLIGIPPLAGFFGKLYVFMEALNQTRGVAAGHADLAGGARAVQLGRLGVLLCAGPQGDVPARAGTETAGPARPGDRHADRAGDGRRGDLRHHARLAHERDAGRRRADVDRPGQVPPPIDAAPTATPVQTPRAPGRSVDRRRRASTRRNS